MTAMHSHDAALLHQLEAAAEPGGQLPKHVAQLLADDGLVELLGPSPGAVTLTAAGRERLAALQRTRADSDDLQP